MEIKEMVERARKAQVIYDERFEHKLHESFRRNYNLYIRVIRKIRVQKN